MDAQSGDISFAPRIDILVVENNVVDFLSRVIGSEALGYDPKDSTLFDASLLSAEHRFGGCETYDEHLRTCSNIVAPEEFVSYTDWAEGIRKKTQEVYGVTFEKYDPFMWEIGYLVSGLIKELKD